MKVVRYPPMVILCGGKATRLSPLTDAIPKSLIEINGKPFIEHQILLLKKLYFKKIVLCLGYMSGQIVDFIISKKRFGMDIQFSFDGVEPLGTGGAIKKAFDFLPNDFFVMYGDSYLTSNYKELYYDYLRRNLFRKTPRKKGVLVVYENNNRYDKSNISLNGNNIAQYNKENPTPEMNYVDYGLSALNKSLFSVGERKFDLSLVFQKGIREKRLKALISKDRFYEVGSFKGIEELSKKLSNNLDENN